MKIETVAAIAVTMACGELAKAQSSQQLPQITVSGSAEVKVAPDEIHFNAGVETISPKLNEAKRQNDERITKVLQFLKSEGLPEKNIQTDFASVDPTYDTKISKIDPTAYVVRRAIGIKLTDVAKFDSILSGLLENGVNHLNGIEFRTSELRKHRDAARAMAIRAAREKADALAKEIGVKRGKVQNINASEYGGWWSSSGAGWWGSRGSPMQNVSQSAAVGPEGAEGTLAVGQISVTATVNVSFLIE